MVISLPFPSAKLSPNARSSWQARLSVKRAERETGWACATAAKADGYEPLSGELTLTITFHAPDKHKRDLDNLHSRMKPMLDGIADALGLDDNQFADVRLLRGAVERGGRVSVRIEGRADDTLARY